MRVSEDVREWVCEGREDVRVWVCDFRAEIWWRYLQKLFNFRFSSRFFIILRVFAIFARKRVVEERFFARSIR